VITVIMAGDQRVRRGGQRRGRTASPLQAISASAAMTIHPRSDR
jgi:hypothetical protein